MGVTAHGLRYPEATDRPIGDDDDTQLGFLADDIDVALSALIPDTGLRTDPPVTLAAGWELLIADYRLAGKDMELRVWAKRTGAAITAANSTGNIADTLFFTIDDPALRPSMDQFGWFRASTTGGAFQLLKDGTCSLLDTHSAATGTQVIPTYTDEVHSTVHLSVDYFIP